MLPKVFEIDEILRPITTHLIDIDGPSAVALACCCKTLQEPVLGLYWEDQPLDKLASVLPTDVLRRSGLEKSPYYVRTPFQAVPYQILIAHTPCAAGDRPPSHSRGTVQIAAICVLDQTDFRGHHAPL